MTTLQGILQVFLHSSPRHLPAARAKQAIGRLCDSLLAATAVLVTDLLVLLLILVVDFTLLLELGGWNPETAVVTLVALVAVAVLEWGILTGKVDGLTLVAVLAALGKVAGTGGKLGADSGVLLNPVGEGVLTVLDDGLRGLVSVVGVAGLTWGDWGVVNQLEKVLAVSGDDGHLLRVLTESVELVVEGSLQLLAGDVGKLSLGDKGFGLGTDELLLENDNLWRVWLLVLELSDLVSDLLLA